MIVQPLRHLRCCDGDAVTFECRIQDNSTGTLNIRWEKGGKVNEKVLRIIERLKVVRIADIFRIDFCKILKKLNGSLQWFLLLNNHRVHARICLLCDWVSWLKVSAFQNVPSRA